MTERDVYKQMLVTLEVHGWTKRTFGTPDGPKCIEGHVNYVLYGVANPAVIGGEHFVLRQQIMNRLAILCDGLRPMAYNDAFGRRKEHIVKIVQLALAEVTPPPPPREQRRRWWHRQPQVVGDKSGHEFPLRR